MGVAYPADFNQRRSKAPDMSSPNPSDTTGAPAPAPVPAGVAGLDQVAPPAPVPAGVAGLHQVAVAAAVGGAVAAVVAPPDAPNEAAEVVLVGGVDKGVASVAGAGGVVVANESVLVSKCV